MNPFLPVYGYLLGRRIREANKELLTDSSGEIANLKMSWAIFYGWIVAGIVFVGELCISDLLSRSLGSALPIGVGIAVLVSPFLTFMLVVFLDQGILGKFEMSVRTTDSFLFELFVGTAALALLWFGYHTGVLQPLHWGWQILICLIPALVFILSSRVAEFFRRPRVRSELRSLGHIFGTAMFVVLADVAGQYMFGRSFLAEITSVLHF